MVNYREFLSIYIEFLTGKNKRKNPENLLLNEVFAMKSNRYANKTKVKYEKKL